MYPVKTIERLCLSPRLLVGSPCKTLTIFKSLHTLISNVYKPRDAVWPCNNFVMSGVLEKARHNVTKRLCLGKKPRILPQNKPITTKMVKMPITPVNDSRNT